RRHTRFARDWSSDVCSSDLLPKDFPFEENLPSPFSEKLDFPKDLEESESWDPSLKNGLRGLFFFISMQHHCCSFVVINKQPKFRSEERRVGKEATSRWGARS